MTRFSLDPLSRRILLVLASLGLVVAIILYAQLQRLPATQEASAPPVSDGVLPPSPELVPPTFDIVRVTREGRAVIAGRAAPAATVVVRQGERIIGTVEVNRRGDWVMIPEEPLAPGAQVLTLTAQVGEHGPVTSNQSAIISVPDRPEGNVLVAVAEPNKATRVLDQRFAPASGDMPAGVSVAGVDLDPEGGAIFSGRAAAGSKILLYLDGDFAGETKAGDDGIWDFRPAGEIADGTLLLRADQIDGAGKVVFRAEVTFERADAGELRIGERKVIVQQGNHLWQIATNIYGSGLAYALIFAGNKDQIRDPDLIYPGQIFRVPSPDSTEQEP